MGVKAVITGRRASQGADRASLQPLEVDSTGLLKLNPLFSWTFPFVEWYANSNKVPRNKLLEQGYRSIGDWHSTAKSGEGDTGERAGRWADKTDKTECGLHVDYFQMKAEAEKRVRFTPCFCCVYRTDRFSAAQGAASHNYACVTYPAGDRGDGVVFRLQPAYVVCISRAACSIRVPFLSSRSRRV